MKTGSLHDEYADVWRGYRNYFQKHFINLKMFFIHSYLIDRYYSLNSVLWYFVHFLPCFYYCNLKFIRIRLLPYKSYHRFGCRVIFCCLQRKCSINLKSVWCDHVNVRLQYLYYICLFLYWWHDESHDCKKQCNNECKTFQH